MDQCQEKILHHAQVARAVKNIPDPETLLSLADIFNALSDPGPAENRFGTGGM
jgi:hypothetical protein